MTHLPQKLEGVRAENEEDAPVVHQHKLIPAGFISGISFLRLLGLSP